MWQANAESSTYSRRRFEFTWRFDSGLLRLLVNLLLFELAFSIAYKYAMSLTPRTGAPFWLPDSVLLCALLLSRPRTWIVYLAATLPLRLVVAVPPGTPLWFLLMAFANDSIKALLAAALLRRVLPGRGIRFDDLNRFWIYLAIAVVAAPALSGVVGAASWVVLGREFWPTWRNWFLGDALANLVVTPLLLRLAMDWRKIIRATPIRYLEGCAIFSGLILTVQFSYEQGLNPNPIDPHGYFPVAFLLLAAVRFGTAGASGAVAIMSLLWITVAAASKPFSSPINDATSILSIQLFLIVLGIPILSLSVMMEQQRRTERSLHESEARFRATFSQAAVGIANLGTDGKWLLLNDRFCKILGYTQAELRGKTFLDITHPDDREGALTARRQLLAGEISSSSMEKRYIRKDHSIVWVSVWMSLVQDQDNQPQYFISVVEDITAKIKVEHALQETRDRLAEAQSAVHLGAWDWDLLTNTHSVSGEYLTLYGLPRDHPPLTYQEWLELVHPEDRERVQALVQEALERTHAWDAEFRVSWPDGSVHWLLEKGRVALDHNGRPIRRAGVVLDITERKQAEGVVRRSLEEIAHLNRVGAMGELAASLAHELNQPLAAILSNAQAANRYLSAQSPDFLQIRECLTDIVTDDKRAGEVIKRLRVLLKKEPFEATPVDLNSVVSDAIRLVQNDALLRKASVSFEQTPNLPIVLGDRVQLYQVVLNLITNGLQAVAAQGERRVVVQTTATDANVELTVKDSGKGIAESDLARVFDPFFTTKAEGLGMGLSISRSIVELHGGRIWAENSAGGGAIFRCVLPATQRTAAAAS